MPFLRQCLWICSGASRGSDEVLGFYLTVGAALGGVGQRRTDFSNDSDMPVIQGDGIDRDRVLDQSESSVSWRRRAPSARILPGRDFSRLARDGEDFLGGVFSAGYGENVTLVSGNKELSHPPWILKRLAAHRPIAV